MKAAVLQAFGQPLAWLDLPRPVPLADEVLLEVLACGVCHSDLHIVDGDTPGFKAGTKAQLIPGHEVVGRVVARGADVSHLAVGQRVGDRAGNGGARENDEACGDYEVVERGGFHMQGLLVRVRV